MQSSYRQVRLSLIALSLLFLVLPSCDGGDTQLSDESRIATAVVATQTSVEIDRAAQATITEIARPTRVPTDTERLLPTLDVVSAAFPWALAEFQIAEIVDRDNEPDPFSDEYLSGTRVIIESSDHRISAANPNPDLPPDWIVAECRQYTDARWAQRSTQAFRDFVATKSGAWSGYEYEVIKHDDIGDWSVAFLGTVMSDAESSLSYPRVELNLFFVRNSTGCWYIASGELGTKLLPLMDIARVQVAS